MIADQVYKGCASAPSVVKIRSPIRQAGAAVHECRCRTTRHPTKTVRGTCCDAFEEAQNYAYVLCLKSAKDRNLRGAGIGEAVIDAAFAQRTRQLARAAHWLRLQQWTSRRRFRRHESIRCARRRASS
jgi:hypothetical protein